MQEKLERGRAFFDRRAWSDAHRWLMLADEEAPLGAHDLERLATCAYLVGLDADFHRFLERAHRAHLDEGDGERAARCAFWLGLTLLFRGEAGQANGWLARARRLLEGRQCVEQGYLLLPEAERQLAAGDLQQARAAAEQAVGAGERFGDADLSACARHVLGRIVIRQGEVAEGLRLLDEAMVSVVSGELSPIMTGLIYCSVIQHCQEVFAVDRAREWTAALACWCEGQPGMVAFTGTCLVHRAEIMQFHGDWPDALEEAGRACRQSSSKPPAEAFYRQGEIHRLRGEFEAAQQAYRDAARLGGEPQPGLALLRLAEGATDAACAAIRRVLGATAHPLRRARLLPAHIEIMLAAGEVEEARGACIELEQIAGKFATEVLRAAADQARGAISLAEGDARAAIAPLRRAFEGWQRVQAPYEAARVRVLIGQACRELGDEESGALDLDAADAEFRRLGAAPDLARLESLGEAVRPAGAHGLTPRELEVLRLVVLGMTNKGIATRLSLSERTVDRHVSNILDKLDVPTRAAATAFAYEHKLV